MMLTSELTKALLQPLDGSRVQKDGKGYSHLEAWDVRRTMNHLFGFTGWSSETTEMVLVQEVETTTKQGKPAWYVVYRARCVVTVGDAVYAEWAAGDATNPTLGDAHDMAIKTAESQAFKRACVNLGDQFGLSLYKNGSTAATVGDVVGRAYEDSERVPDLLKAFTEADSMDDLAVVAQDVAASDLSDGDKTLLRNAYTAAKSRLDAA